MKLKYHNLNKTALYLAVKSGNSGIINILLSNDKINPSALNVFKLYLLYFRHIFKYNSHLKLNISMKLKTNLFF